MIHHLRVCLVVCIVVSVALLYLPILSLHANSGWSDPVNLSASAVGVEDAAIVIDSNGWIHVVWSEGEEIYHCFHGGSGWSAPIHVTSGHSPDLAADSSSHVYMVFADLFGESDDVYFASWQASTGWGTPVNVSESTDLSSSPRIAVASNGGLAVVWSEQSADAALIYLARSVDGGLWSSFPLPYAFGSRPVLAFAAADDLWVAWQDVLDVGFSTEVFVTRWSGGQWTLPEDVSLSFTVDSVLPAIAVRQGKVYLTWQEGVPGQEAVYLSQWQTGAWSVPEKRSASGQAFAPALALAASGDGHLAWTTQDAVQYVTWATSSGIWGPLENVALGQVGAFNARFALGNSIHLLWLAQTSSDRNDVYYSVKGVPSTTPTFTVTPTYTATPTFTSTATATPTATRTATQTCTPTGTATLMPTSTLTLTPTATVTAVPSATPTSTATRTATVTPTQPGTATPTLPSVSGWHLFLPQVLRYLR